MGVRNVGFVPRRSSFIMFFISYIILLTLFKELYSLILIFPIKGSEYVRKLVKWDWQSHYGEDSHWDSCCGLYGRNYKNDIIFNKKKKNVAAVESSSVVALKDDEGD